MRYVYEHDGHPAFYMNRKPERGDLARSRPILFRPNGKPMPWGSEFRCHTCNSTIQPIIDNVKLWGLGMSWKNCPFASMSGFPCVDFGFTDCDCAFDFPVDARRTKDQRRTWQRCLWCLNPVIFSIFSNVHQCGRQRCDRPLNPEFKRRMEERMKADLTDSDRLRQYAARQRSLLKRIFERNERLKEFVEGGFWEPEMMKDLESLAGLIDALKSLKAELVKSAHPNCRCAVDEKTIRFAELYGMSKFRLARFLDCPKCGGGMVKKVNSYTDHPFYGCKAWPSCDGSRDWDDPTKDRGRKIKDNVCVCHSNGNLVECLCVRCPRCR